jgi:hypothetical protein|tara:strand:+ start:1503 stop:1769 length:267 start_codon:yes stop_codon:yes gene_type:complete
MELNEYIIDVNLYNKKDKLKVWATNSTEAIDSMLALEMVTEIYSIKRLSDNKSWNFTGNINLLRDIRNEIDDEGLINFEIVNQGEVND